MKKAPQNILEAHKVHSREFEDNKYVYPVISRRSGGVSLGINLNIDKKCNFDCPYCQVNRETTPLDTTISIPEIMQELQEMLKHFDSEGVCTLKSFHNIPAKEKVLRDVALSGDGEPTSFLGFEEVCRKLSDIQTQSALPFKLVLITNATMLQKQNVKKGAAHLLRQQGSIWVKLDAGTEDYFQKVNVSRFTLQGIVSNIKDFASGFPITLQTLFFQFNGQGPSKEELLNYREILFNLIAGGARIKGVQLHSVSRAPAVKACEALKEPELHSIAEFIREKVDVKVEVF